MVKKVERVKTEGWDKVNKFNREIAEEFLETQTELSPATIKTYRTNFKIWFTWVRDNLDNKRVTEIKPIEYKRFQNWMVNRGCSTSDIATKRSCISSLNQYIEIYYSDMFPMFRNFINKSIKLPPATPVHEKIPLTREEYHHLLEVLTEREEWQKIAYLTFTFDTGCRRAESAQLLKEVVDYKPIEKKHVVKKEDGTEEIKTVRFYRTHPIRCKGAGREGKVRQFLFSEDTMAALKQWVYSRGEDDCEFMFVTKLQNGEVRHVGNNTFNRWCQFEFSEIVGRRVHPHQFRVTRASSLAVDEGVDIKVIQKLLGHNSSTTTEGYIVRDDSDDLDELYFFGDDEVTDGET